MELRSSIESLKTLLDVSSTSSEQITSSVKESDSRSPLVKGDSATLSNVGSEISQATSIPEIRTAKVAAIQAAIASGTYRVAPSAVATKVVDSMIDGGSSSGN